jgi:hypothetical protein
LCKEKDDFGGSTSGMCSQGRTFCLPGAHL